MTRRGSDKFKLLKIVLLLAATLCPSGAVVWGLNVGKDCISQINENTYRSKNNEKVLIESINRLDKTNEKLIETLQKIDNWAGKIDTKMNIYHPGQSIEREDVR